MFRGQKGPLSTRFLQIQVELSGFQSSLGEPYWSNPR
jgi:hypothetical protein